MTTYPHPHRLQMHRRRHLHVWLVAVIGLAAALVGLASWVLVDHYAGGSSAADKAATLIDKEYAYISAGNVNAATALFTPDAIVWQGGTTSAIGTAKIHTVIAAAHSAGFTATRTAPVTIQGEFAATYFRTPVSSHPVLTVFQLRDGKIFREWDFELGSTTPFNTANP